ncbi:hypothetical protein CONCODRAFT_52483 [Conidiobolus coronatus NRRL 28638]|uniref:Xylanolytic transcriptional activator regulatory domain-containing protein n=1 Tax=Conidiobolus coronatus (strain ATCC 28846 / CBS 209.66 / NRRL 28638) TaxID=796925 RepID=A0A137NXG2_CONC2|nr:hypothetical protein CONCODRAFT_52483 [Conidiobolus coronatus NRRL 28638]|eukprot:KXN67358.1 hypothetical protein CONCODRAFT_52483 [Conidiobolus coronatus NRRL 28638]
MEKLLQPLKNLELRGLSGGDGSMGDGDSERNPLSPDQSNRVSSLRDNDSSTALLEGENYSLPDCSLLFPSLPTPPTLPVPQVSPEVSEHLISLYFAYQHPLLSMIHRTTFLQNLQAGKQCSLLLYTMYAFASRFSSHPEVAASPPYTAGEQYISHAKLLLESSTYSTPSLSTVQGLVLISLHEYGCNRYPTAWMYSGLAVRMGQHLNLYCADKDDGRPSKLDWIEIETRRRVWFGCCLMDRLISTKTSWPMAIHDEDCQVKFPSDDYNWENNINPILESSEATYSFHSQVSRGGMVTVPDHMSQFAKILSLMAQVNQFSNRPSGGRSRPSADQEQLVRLDSSLLEWTFALPPHLTYSPKMMSNPTPETQMTFAAIVMIHSLYQAIVIILHRSNLGRYLHQLEPIHDQHLSPLRCIAATEAIVQMVKELGAHSFLHYIPFYPYVLYEAGTILVNRCFSNDSAVATSARSDLQLIYLTLKSFEPFWGIAQTYCTSLKGLYALRISRDSNPDNSNANPASSMPNTEVLTWLVPLKSSLHEWYPYLEKLAANMDDDFLSKPPEIPTPATQQSATQDLPSEGTFPNFSSEQTASKTPNGMGGATMSQDQPTMAFSQTPNMMNPPQMVPQTASFDPSLLGLGGQNFDQSSMDAIMQMGLGSGMFADQMNMGSQHGQSVTQGYNMMGNTDLFNSLTQDPFFDVNNMLNNNMSSMHHNNQQMNMHQHTSPHQHPHHPHHQQHQQQQQQQQHPGSSSYQ